MQQRRDRGSMVAAPLTYKSHSSVRLLSPIRESVKRRINLEGFRFEVLGS